MNLLNQKIWILQVQIEAEKRLLKNGKGSNGRLDQLRKELKECLEQMV